MKKSAIKIFLSTIVTATLLVFSPANADQNSIASERIAKLRAAADANDSNAQFELGYSYLVGSDVAKDKNEAVKLIKRAADNGNTAAQSQLGTLFYQGSGVPQDANEAIRWWNLAADKHDHNAESQLGFAYLLGDGVQQNYVNAYMWFNIAAADGDQHAAKDRDSVAQKMKAEQVSQAHKLLEEWAAKHPKKPGS